MIKMIMEPGAPSGDEQRQGESRSNDLRQLTRSSHWNGRAEKRAERAIAAERTSAAGPTTAVRRRAGTIGDIATSKSKRKSKRQSEQEQAQSINIIKG